MAFKLLLSVLCLSFALSQQFIVVKDGFGKELYLQLRHKRETSVQASGQGSKVTGLTVEQTGGIASWGGGDHVVKGGGIVHKTVGGPISTGGSLSYNHEPSNTQLKVSGVHTPIWGNDVTAEASKTLFSKGGAELSASAGVSQHLGGLPGNGKPEGNVALKFEYRPPVQAPLPPDVQQMICRMTRPAYSCP